MQYLEKMFSKTVAAAVIGLSCANSALAAEETGDTVTITNPLGDKDLTDIIQGLINFVFGLALLICPIFIIWGGFEIATAAGADTKIKEGRQKITYALVGLVIIALSSTFVAVIKGILGVEGE
ncbi:MAG: pilin [Candidatus Nealsonbacteria bacterium DGGOD1a]|jgi:hypothetical protein|nr:MAG: pilin [Candidatus Nealsonbacteria bacterium DGGOD1a]